MDLKKILIHIAVAIGIDSLIYNLRSFLNRCIISFLHSKKGVSENKKVAIHGISSCFPSNCYSQTQMKRMFIKNYCGDENNILPRDLDFINRVFNATLIQKSYLSLPQNLLFSRMNRQQYTEHVKTTMLSMACQSAQQAIRNTNGLKLSDITHLIFGTMTGTISAPSMDIHISKQLNLNMNVKRLNVESMGCLTGFRLVGLSSDIALQSRNNIVLLIVSDIRSALGNQLTTFKPNKPIDRSNVIVSALFRDACGAAIFSQRNVNNQTKSCYIIDHHSSIIENTLELGRLKEYSDGSVHLYLDKQLPHAVFNDVPNIVLPLLKQYCIDIKICQFAVHTGGPKIINGIQKCLYLREEQLCASWFCMKKYGNLSGSSNLVVLEHLLRWKYTSQKFVCDDVVFPNDFNQYKYIVGLSFGPGIALECVLFGLE